MREVERGTDLVGVLTHADVCVVRKDSPQWRDWTAADLSGMRRKVVVDGRRIPERGAMKGVELIVLGGSSETR